MSAKTNLTKSANISVTAREIDFVTRFGLTWEALLNILGITRPIVKQPGAVLKSKIATVTLESGSVAEGDSIGFSQASVTEKTYSEMDILKYAKGVPIEAIKTHGYDVAVAKTDEEFLNELQKKVMNDFYTYIKTGTLTNIQTNFQKALAMAKGYVLDKFDSMNRTVTDVVAFVNILDVYEYLGTASVTVQNKFGFNYIQDFMGYKTVFCVEGNKIPRNKVIATPVENLVMYYVNPAESDFARAGLSYTVAGVTPLIGFHTEADYSRATSDCYAIMGMVLFAEYLNGIAVVTIDAGTTSGSATITSAAGTEEGTKISVTAPTTLADDWRYFIKAASTAPTAPDYTDEPDSTWTEIKVDEDGVCDNLTGLTASNKAVLVITNATKQVIYASAAAGVAIVNKT